MEWLKKAGQWVVNNPDRFSATASDIAGMVAPRNTFAASGLGRKMAEQRVFSQARERQQEEQDEARRLLSGVLSGKIKPTAREEHGLSGLSLKPNKEGNMELRADYTILNDTKGSRPDRASSSSLAGEPVSRPGEDPAWDVQVGPDGTPQFSWRNPSMEGRIPPPEAVELMLQARQGSLSQERPQSTQSPQPTVTTPSFSLNQAQAQSQRSLPLDILPIEQQMALAQSGRYTDELNLAMAKMLQDQRYRDQALALKAAQMARNSRTEPGEAKLYYDADGKLPPRWIRPGEFVPSNMYLAQYLPEQPEPPETTLDLAHREQYRDEFYNYLDYARRGEFPLNEKDPRGNVRTSELTPERVQQLNQMSMNLGNNEFYEYVDGQPPKSFGGFSIPGTTTKPTIRTLRLRPEVAGLLPKMRELALEDGWEEVIREFKRRGLLVESPPMPTASGDNQ